MNRFFLQRTSTSGADWPGFTRQVTGADRVEKKDIKLFSLRTEVRSRKADSHPGHVLSDGPDLSGLRYCPNSASLRIVPEEKEQKKGMVIICNCSNNSHGFSCQGKE